MASSSTASNSALFVSGTANELIGIDNRWGELWVTNFTAGTGTIPSINGDSFFTEILALSGVTNQIKAAIRDQAGNMSYIEKDYFVPSTGGAQAAATAYLYDAAGCVTNLNGTSLEWDERYRLTAISSQQSAISYEYDVLDRRISRIDGSSTNYFIYDGNQIVADLDENGSLLRTYVWGAGIDNLLCFTDHTTTNTYYAIKDHQNTVIALMNETGAVVESYEYDAYGNTTIYNSSSTEISQSAVGNRYCFQGREYDTVTQLYYFRARWYDAESGKWLSKDPIGIAGGLNQYVAFNSNPVFFLDPDGESAIAAYDYWTDMAASGYSQGGSGGWLKVQTGNTMGMFINMWGAQEIEKNAALSGEYSVDEECQGNAWKHGAISVGYAAGNYLKFGGLSGLDRFRQATAGATVADIFRTGKTVVSNQIVNGPGTKGATVTWAIKGGGGKLPFHYHIHKYNWYKPWIWGKQTPILK